VSETAILRQQPAGVRFPFADNPIVSFSRKPIQQRRQHVFAQMALKLFNGAEMFLACRTPGLNNLEFVAHERGAAMSCCVMLNSRRYLPHRSHCSSDALQDIRWAVTSGGSKAYLIVEQRSELEVRRFSGAARVSSDPVFVTSSFKTKRGVKH
jgi:hypothetical protein